VETPAPSRGFRLKDLLQRLAFVGLAAFLWLLTKSASTGFSLHLTQEIVITDIPGVIPEETNQTVHVELLVKTAGVKSLGLRLSGLPTLTLGYHTLTMSTWGTEDLLWWVANNRSLLEEELPDGVQLIHLKPDSLFLPITPMASKSIPVVFRGIVPLPTGYQTTDQPQLEPQSVVVYGPQDALDGIQELALNPSQLESGTSPGVYEAKIEPLNRLTFSHQRILMQVKVEPFTEWKGKIPVSVVGVPKGLKVVAVPDSVDVSIPVPIRLYRKRPQADWVAQIHYPAWKEAGQPEWVRPVLNLPSGPLLLPAIRPIPFVR
jgi:hypothetical protein